MIVVQVTTICSAMRRPLYCCHPIEGWVRQLWSALFRKTYQASSDRGSLTRHNQPDAKQNRNITMGHVTCTIQSWVTDTNERHIPEIKSKMNGFLTSSTILDKSWLVLLRETWICETRTTYVMLRFLNL